MKNTKIYIVLFVLLLGTSCELDLLDNPNGLSEDAADVNYLFNNVQLSFKSFFHTASAFGMDNTRMANMGGSTYESAYSPSSFDGIWGEAYSTFLADVKALVPMAEESSLFYHAGMARIMEAYVLITMVDYFGEVPYSQALDETNFNPEVDGGADIYAAALSLADAGIADFGKASLAKPSTDLYYGSDAARWIKLANSIKLKAYVQSRLVNNSKSQIEALLGGGGDLSALIATTAEDFQFQYGTSNSSPDSRHPDFGSNYVNGGSKYMSNYFMGVLYSDKPVIDPRMTYYFYRQTLKISTNPIDLPCAGASRPTHYPNNVPYCTLGDGYWGRDHLDDDGIPPDTKMRTIWGVYPAGGKYDDGKAAAVTQDAGGKGAGIEPIMTSSFVKFMLAEANLTLNVAGIDARTLLAAAVRESCNKVIGFAAVDPAYAGHTGTTVEDYVTAVLTSYDAAASTQDKLNVVLKEYYIALFGNGIESYNTYRRTGMPRGFQPALQANPGKYYRSFIYPANYITRNSNAKQKDSPSVQVFWDTNPTDFIN